MQDQNNKEYIKVTGKDLVKKIKELLKAGNATKIIIQNEEGKNIMEIPLTIGVVGVAFAPVLAAVGAMAALVTNCTLVVVKKP
ncbi:MAG: DUF4342 domain-containing protein [bacterium]|nr:DUF4342 domain-containing protein [bacterium]